jgi:hypothetical protein
VRSAGAASLLDPVERRAAVTSGDGFYPAVLGRRQRLVTGVVGIGLGFGVPFVLSVVLVATSGDPSFLILPLPFLGALWLAQGLAPVGYALEDEGVRIERRWNRRLVPYDQIQRVDRAPRRIGGLGGVGWNALFGAHGVRWNPWSGWHYLAITNTEALVALVTPRGLAVLSPDRPDAFVAALEEILAARARAARPATREDSDR